VQAEGEQSITRLFIPQIKSRVVGKVNEEERLI
jgi:hypothetical protein